MFFCFPSSPKEHRKGFSLYSYFIYVSWLCFIILLPNSRWCMLLAIYFMYRNFVFHVFFSSTYLVISRYDTVLLLCLLVTFPGVHALLLVSLWLQIQATMIETCNLVSQTQKTFPSLIVKDSWLPLACKPKPFSWLLKKAVGFDVFTLEFHGCLHQQVIQCSRSRFADGRRSCGGPRISCTALGKPSSQQARLDWTSSLCTSL